MKSVTGRIIVKKTGIIPILIKKNAEENEFLENCC